MFHSRQFSSHSSVPFSFVPNLLTLDKFMIPHSWLIDSSTPTACFVLVSLCMCFFCSYVLRPPFVYNNLPRSINCCLTMSVLWFSKKKQAKNISGSLFAMIICAVLALNGVVCSMWWRPAQYVLFILFYLLPICCLLRLLHTFLFVALTYRLPCQWTARCACAPLLPPPWLPALGNVCT